MKNPSITLQGILWTLLSCVAFAFMTAMVRHVSITSDYSTFQLVFMRNFAALLALAPWLLSSGGFKVLRLKKMKTYMWRIATGLASMMLWFYALGRMPLADATALSFIGPIFISIGAQIFLKEKMGVRRWTAVIVGILGAMVILRPGFEQLTYASIAVIFSCLLSSFSQILVKKLSLSESAFVMVLYLNILMSAFSLPFALPGWKPLDQTILLWCLGIGMASNIGQYSMVRAYALVDITLTLPFDFTRLIVASILGYFAFSETPDALTFLGAAIVISSSVYIVHREALVERKRLEAEMIAGEKTGADGV